jgi:hypothetical protein
MQKNNNLIMEASLYGVVLGVVAGVSRDSLYRVAARTSRIS